jgi:hypothetical protein
MLKQQKIRDAYYEPLKEFAIGFYYFCNKYIVEHPVPIPSDDELWYMYIEKLSNEEKLHTA